MRIAGWGLQRWGHLAPLSLRYVLYHMILICAAGFAGAECEWMVEGGA